MANVSFQIVEAQKNTIRECIYDKLMSDRQICEYLNIHVTTLYDYKRKILQQDSQAWNQLHADSGQYRAVELVNILDECKNLALSISRDSNHDPRLRLEANKVAAESAANIMKIVMEGPTFKTSLPEIKGTIKAIEDKAKIVEDKAKATVPDKQEDTLELD